MAWGHAPIIHHHNHSFLSHLVPALAVMPQSPEKRQALLCLRSYVKNSVGISYGTSSVHVESGLMAAARALLIQCAP